MPYFTLCLAKTKIQEEYIGTALVLVRTFVLSTTVLSLTEINFS